MILKAGATLHGITIDGFTEKALTVTIPGGKKQTIALGNQAKILVQ